MGRERTSTRRLLVGAVAGACATLLAAGVLTSPPAVPRAADEWEAVLRAQWSGAEPGGEYGAAVVRGDLDQDGWPEICIGAPGEDGGAGAAAGAVHVLDGKDFTERVVLRGLAAGDRFGHALAVTDWNRDSHIDLVVGAPGAAAGAGAVYVVTDAHKKKPGQPLLLLNGQRVGDRLGWSVASAPARGGGLDLNGVLVGAPGYDDKVGDECGRALMLLDDGKRKPPEVVKEWIGSSQFAELGAFVARGSYPTEKYEWVLLIGAPGASVPAALAGKPQTEMPQLDKQPPLEETGTLIVLEGDEELLRLNGESAGERFGTAGATVRLHGEGVQYGDFLAGGRGLARVFSRHGGGRPKGALQPDPGETGFGLNVADIGQIDPSYQFAFVVATLREPSGDESFTGLRIVAGQDLSVLVRVPRPAADHYGAAMCSLLNESDPTVALLVGAPGRDAGAGAVELLDIRRSKR